MDITIKNLPDEISEKRLLEWVAILVERTEKQKVNILPAVVAATTSAEEAIDSFRKGNNLDPKFEVKPSVEPVEEPIDPVKQIIGDKTVTG